MADFYLQKIEITNFRSIVHQDFELREGLFVIIGDNKDTPGVTNGAGKTSLISAFFWAVTGCSLNGEDAKDDVINLKTGKNCKVRCIFKVDGDDVIIQRTRKDSELDNSLYFEINGQDMSCHKMADTQERIDNYLKIPSSLLKSIIIMTSSMESRFSDLTNQGRIELLESIRDYAIWNNIREEANKDMKTYTGQISELESKINQTVGSVSTYQNLIESLQQKYRELQNQDTTDAINNKIAENNTRIAEIIQQIEGIVIDTTEISAIEQQVASEQDIIVGLASEQQNEISEINANKDEEKKDLLSQVDDCQSKITDQNTEISKLATEQQNEISVINTNKEDEKKALLKQVEDYQSQITSQNSEMSKLVTETSLKTNELNLIEKWFTNDTCPTCNRKLDRTAEEIQTKTNEKTELTNAIQGFQNQMDSIKNSIQENQDKITALKEQVSGIDVKYTNQIDDVKTKYEQKGQQHRDNIDTIKTQITQLKEQIAAIDVKYSGQIDEVNNKYVQKGQQHRDNINALKAQITSLQNANTALSNQKQQLETEKVRLEGDNTQLNLQLTGIADKLKETVDQGKEYRSLVDQLTQQMDTDKSEVESIKKDKEMMNFFYQQLGPKGALRPYLLSRDIVFLNSCLKRYVNKFFEDTEVYLTVPSQTEKDIKIIVKPKTGLVTPVSSLSGGERKRVDLCIQLALYDLVQSTATFHINFVCFDEIESALDAAGIRALIDVVEERQDIIPTILWISNRDEVIECIKDKIVVTKINGESEVHYA